jgi:hypothetical protein
MDANGLCELKGGGDVASRAFRHVNGDAVKALAAKQNGDGIQSSDGRGSTETVVGANGGIPAQFDAAGKFAKGNTLSQRPKATDNRAYIDAIKAEFPPERITELINIAIQIAQETKSWRGVVAASEFAANYSLGKPVKRVESTGDSSLADLLAGVDTSKPLMAGPAKDNGEDADDEG